jgi:hypothetical protein
MGPAVYVPLGGIHQLRRNPFGLSFFLQGALPLPLEYS